MDRIEILILHWNLKRATNNNCKQIPLRAATRCLCPFYIHRALIDSPSKVVYLSFPTQLADTLLGGVAPGLFLYPADQYTLYNYDIPSEITAYRSPVVRRDCPIEQIFIYPNAWEKYIILQP